MNHYTLFVSYIFTLNGNIGYNNCTVVIDGKILSIEDIMQLEKDITEAGIDTDKTKPDKKISITSFQYLS